MAKNSFFSRLIDKAVELYKYCSVGVWNDTRRSLRVRAVKILNLGVSSFLNRDLQIRSMSLTYSTVLSIVPALALMVAIGRGFGLQETLQNELYVLLPSQHRVISTFLGFVDSYLTSASQGVFVGVGIIVLLWTIFSLLSGIENTFNSVWDIKKGRSLYRQFTDYIAICLMVPVLLICSAGISIFMSTTIQNILFLPLLSPMVNCLLELAPLVLYWLAFSLSFFLFPNTKVNFKYAAVSGVFAAIAFYILQWLFINGQIYVSKYNAIYGSFAFLPLLLIWLQLSWLILISGCVLTYSLQNVLSFNFIGDASRISPQSLQRMVIITTAVIARRFKNRQELLSTTQMAKEYNMPIRVLEHLVQTLNTAGIISYISRNDGTITLGPGRDLSKLSAGDVLAIYNTTGESEVTPDFNEIYDPLFSLLDSAAQKACRSFDSLLLTELPIPTPEQIALLIGEDSENKSGTGHKS